MPWMTCADAALIAKTQFINADNFNKLVKYMEDKYPEFLLDKERAETKEDIYFEYSGYGPMVGAQPRMKFLLPTSTLRLDCVDVTTWIAELKEAVKRKFQDGTEYYKLYSRFTCLILTPEERESLLFQLIRQEEKANKEAGEFFNKLQEAYDKIEYSFENLFPKIPIITLPPEDNPEK